MPNPTAGETTPIPINVLKVETPSIVPSIADSELTQVQIDAIKAQEINKKNEYLASNESSRDALKRLIKGLEQEKTDE